MISVATAVDYATDCMFKDKSNTVSSVSNEVQTLLTRSLGRLAQAQEELQLNCEDQKQLSEANKMVTLLTLRCLLGVGKDLLAFESLKNRGLDKALNKIHLDEMSSSGQTIPFVTLKNVRLMGRLAKERKMHETSRCLQRLCAHQLSQTGKFLLEIGEHEVVILGEIQRDIIQSAVSTREILEMYEEVNLLVEKHGKVSKQKNTDKFYSVEDLTWFVKDAHNRAVQYELLGDDNLAAKLFAVALNLVPLCGQDVQCHAQSMNIAYQQAVSKMRSRGDSLSSIWNLISD